ncbi:MAG: LON peptidase substrate-binding domain-containing protein [Ignavibacteria bacterium]|nr:LON peptidase substrate-binding domain-containing protein [Ignavibacteria bacterium]
MTLGLFPLNIVLFPHSQVPLHIYEPRYRALINECITQGSEFGINLVEQGHLHTVGCTARVASVTERFPDGRINVVIEGVNRFRLLNVHEDQHTYVVGETEPITDDEGPTDPLLVASCAEMYNQIIELVYGESGSVFDAETIGDKSPAFLMAPKSGLTSEQKQQLLEMNSENSRLEMLRDHLAEIIPAIQKAETVQRIIRSDGYIINRD